MNTNRHKHRNRINNKATATQDRRGEICKVVLGMILYAGHKLEPVFCSSSYRSLDPQPVGIQCPLLPSLPH